MPFPVVWNFGVTVSVLGPKLYASVFQKELSMRHLIISVLALLARLSVVAVALFLFVGAVHADILVSDHNNGYVEKCSDDGKVCNQTFIAVDANQVSSEGVSCVNRSTNRIYAADGRTHEIQAYYLSGPKAGQKDNSTSFVIQGAIGEFASLVVNAAGNVMYVGGWVTPGTGAIYAVNIPDNPSGPCSSKNPCSVSTAASKDVLLGPDGRLYASGLFNSTGVVSFSAYTPNSATWNAGPAIQFIAPNGGGNGHFLNQAGALVFDGGGNLWLANYNYPSHTNDAIFEFTGPLNPQPGRFLNFTADAGAGPAGMDISPVNPPAPPIDACKGCTVIANIVADTVTQIDPSSCTGTITTPGTCTMQAFISSATLGVTAAPKYVKFIENCSDIGYVEICKMTCAQNPVSGYFNFTAQNADSFLGPFSIPVNACSGAIQIPNGTVTINEQFAFGGGTEVTGITAYNYDYLGNQINALTGFNLPFQIGNVDVVSGDVSTETVVGFTNCASGPGELKICKVAGNGVKVNTPFTFEVDAGVLYPPTFYTVPAGPPPSGYCVVAGSYPVGTFVSVTEPYLSSGTTATNIMVAPADRGGMQQLGGCHGFFSCPYTIAVIDSGTTEVTFTNTTTTVRPNP
jgi:hypothetical protein